MNADIIVQRGCYQCGTCGQPLQFDLCSVTRDIVAIGWCGNGHEPDCGYPNCTLHEKNCHMWKVKLRIPLQRLSCEIVPELVDMPLVGG